MRVGEDSTVAQKRQKLLNGDRKTTQKAPLPKYETRHCFLYNARPWAGTKNACSPETCPHAGRSRITVDGNAVIAGNRSRATTGDKLLDGGRIRIAGLSDDVVLYCAMLKIHELEAEGLPGVALVCNKHKQEADRTYKKLANASHLDESAEPDHAVQPTSAWSSSSSSASCDEDSTDSDFLSCEDEVVAATTKPRLLGVPGGKYGFPVQVEVLNAVLRGQNGTEHEASQAFKSAALGEGATPAITKGSFTKRAFASVADVCRAILTLTVAASLVVMQGILDVEPMRVLAIAIDAMFDKKKGFVCSLTSCETSTGLVIEQRFFTCESLGVSAAVQMEKPASCDVVKRTTQLLIDNFHAACVERFLFVSDGKVEVNNSMKEMARTVLEKARVPGLFDWKLDAWHVKKNAKKSLSNYMTTLVPKVSGGHAKYGQMTAARCDVFKGDVMVAIETTAQMARAATLAATEEASASVFMQMWMTKMNALVGAQEPEFTEPLSNVMFEFTRNFVEPHAIDFVGAHATSVLESYHSSLDRCGISKSVHMRKLDNFSVFALIHTCRWNLFRLARELKRRDSVADRVASKSPAHERFVALLTSEVADQRRARHVFDVMVLDALRADGAPADSLLVAMRTAFGSSSGDDVDE